VGIDKLNFDMSGALGLIIGFAVTICGIALPFIFIRTATVIIALILIGIVLISHSYTNIFDPVLGGFMHSQQIPEKRYP